MSDTCQQSTALIVDAAQRLSAAANSVAGFAVAQSLLLIYACLKDLRVWVEEKGVWFYFGIGIGTFVYIAATWYLHRREMDVLRSLPADALPAKVADVSTVLARCRTAAIAYFAIIAVFGVWGASRGYLA